MAEFPVDIIYDILSRTPIKSLHRFRCVCKHWCKYIDDPNLAIIHVKRVVEEPATIIFNRYPPAPPNLLQKYGLFRIIESKEGATGPEVQEDLLLEFEYKEPFYHEHMLRGSCNGLLYLSHNSIVPTCTFSVINPLRKERYESPPIRAVSSCGLGFDASNHTFKICVLVENHKTSRIMVHVLGTDSWREILHVPYYLMLGDGVFAYGSLHWFGRHKQCQLSTTNEDKVIVIRFDVRKEEFGLIDPPRKTTDSGWFAVKLVDLHDEVGFVYCSSRSYDSWELWVLKHNQWLI
ncbi:hypothetical protein L1887_07544 [Cichorium endivia]|nr:hypothetical protein L1887_07544 [Cichorium endivia]